MTCCKEYGNDFSAARRHYRAYVQACLLEDDGPLLEAMAASRYAIGGSAFIERTEERIEERRSGRVQDRDLDLPRWTVSLEEIDAAVAAALPHGSETVLGPWPPRRAGEGRSGGVGGTTGRHEQPRDRRTLWDRCDGGRSEPLSADDAARCVESRRDAGGPTADKETKVLNSTARVSWRGVYALPAMTYDASRVPRGCVRDGSR